MLTLPRFFWVVWILVTIVLQGCNALPTQETRSLSLAEMEVAVLLEINTIRQNQGQPALRPNAALAQVARSYSERMATQNFFSHTDPAGNQAVQRLFSAGISFELVGENLYRSVNAADPIQDAVQGWMASPSHRETLLRPIFTETGVGAWQDGETYYFTQLFIQPRGNPPN
jgi:uncharacterized protein YkwD